MATVQHEGPIIKPQHTSTTLIVGAGLAGCCLARQLERAGLPFKLIGCSRRPSAAKVAAGIINPITGRWMTKSWRFDDFADEAAAFYAEIEEARGIRIYHRLPAVRYCLSAEDARRAGRRCRNPRYANVLGNDENPKDDPKSFQNAHGRFRIRGAAYVNLPETITALRRGFLAGEHYEDEAFQYGELRETNRAWHYRRQTFARVVFCEGAALKDNPWFNYLPLQPAKGETLLFRSEGLDSQGSLVHHGKWLLPYPDGSFRIGATYEENDLSQDATEAGARELLDAFDAMTIHSHRLEILDQPAGIRPSTADARPFLGAHPSKAGLFVFNGLGSKGASLAPTLSRELTDHIFESKPLHPETDIRRFS